MTEVRVTLVAGPGGVSVECDDPARLREMLVTVWNAQRRNGDPVLTMTPATPDE